MSQLYSPIIKVKDAQEVATYSLTLPKLINPYLGSCKVILFSNKKEGLCIALQDKINLRSTQIQSQPEYIDFSKFVQVTRYYMLASGYKDDKTGVFDLIHCKKLEGEGELDNELLEEFGLSWYPLSEVKQLLSPIELSFIDRMNQPATFAVQK